MNFREIKGINELNNGKPRQIIKSTPISFFISDKLKYEDYISGGICEEVKSIITKKYNSFKNKLFIPYEDEKPMPFDFTKIVLIKSICSMWYYGRIRYLNTNKKL